jgi:hypothetical protein
MNMDRADFMSRAGMSALLGVCLIPVWSLSDSFVGRLLIALGIAVCTFALSLVIRPPSATKQDTD